MAREAAEPRRSRARMRALVASIDHGIATSLPTASAPQNLTPARPDRHTHTHQGSQERRERWGEGEHRRRREGGVMRRGTGRRREGRMEEGGREGGTGR
eukprot:3734470-Rhodomonas_salina.1